MTAKVETVMKMINDYKLNTQRDYNRSILMGKREMEKKMVEMCDMMTKEVEYMNNRMKQTLLYQIGMIDDPWQITDDAIVDDEYSQDSQDSKDFYKIQRYHSIDKFMRTKIESDKVEEFPNLQAPPEFIEHIGLEMIDDKSKKLRRNKTVAYLKRKGRLVKHQFKYRKIYDKREDEKRRKDIEDQRNLVKR